MTTPVPAIESKPAATEIARTLPRYDQRALQQVLAQHNELSEADWRLIGEVSRQQGISKLRAVLDLGLLSEDALADRLAQAMDCPRWRDEDEQASLCATVPVEFMRGGGVLALENGEMGVRLVVADPSDHHTLSALVSRFRGGSNAPVVTLAIGTHKQITAFLERSTTSADATDASAIGPGDAMDVSGEITALRDLASEAPVIRFFNQVVERAMELGASDIHLERFDRRVSLRLRVDGLLVEQPAPAMAMYEPLLCRVKIMSGLDIAERRRAQDGRIRLRLRGRNVDMRVSIVPTMYGQDAAIRIQDRQRLAEISLADLGFAPEHIASLETTANKSHGILLITGPTGSGKTTTLYAILRGLVSSEVKIVTVEDPVEYAMDGVNQIQVNPAINLTFGNTLRNVLRHDPDAILIGEIRDRETAEIAFQAALTGHMVLSTLHTNDVPGTFVRLVDMGVEPYLVNAAVEGVSAQRLLRRLCPTCAGGDDAKETCRTCGGIGYRGRVGVMEFAAMSSAVKKAMLEGAEEHHIRAALVSAGYRTMMDDARRQIANGVTDQAEVARALGHGGES